MYITLEMCQCVNSLTVSQLLHRLTIAIRGLCSISECDGDKWEKQAGLADGRVWSRAAMDSREPFQRGDCSDTLLRPIVSIIDKLTPNFAAAVR